MSLILAWNSSSPQQLIWLHGLATSRHAISIFVQLIATLFSFKQSLSIFLLLPIHMLHSDPGCENHIISKMMAKHTTECWVWNANSSHLGFSFFFSPETFENPNEKFTTNPTGALARTAKNSTGKPNFLSPYWVPSQPKYSCAFFHHSKKWCGFNNWGQNEACG